MFALFSRKKATFQRREENDPFCSLFTPSAISYFCCRKADLCTQTCSLCLKMYAVYTYICFLFKADFTVNVITDVF